MIDAEGDGRLTIHIQDDDIREVLDMLSEQGNLNILASKSVQGKVSATLNGVDIDSALEAILKSTGYVSRREGNFIFVGTPEDFTTMEQALDRVGTRVYRPNYVTAAELQTLITAAADREDRRGERLDAGRGRHRHRRHRRPAATSSPAARWWWSATTRPCWPRSTRWWPRSTSGRCRSPSRP